MYYNGYIRLYTVTVAALFLLSPLLALPYILLGIYRQERSAYFFLCLILRILCMATSSIVRFVQAFAQYISLFRQTFLLYVCEQAVRRLLYSYCKLDISKCQHSISISPVVFNDREFFLADNHI
mgnify:CR=1 FL=1